MLLKIIDNIPEKHGAIDMSESLQVKVTRLGDLVDMLMDSERLYCLDCYQDSLTVEVGLYCIQYIVHHCCVINWIGLGYVDYCRKE